MLDFKQALRVGGCLAKKAAVLQGWLCSGCAVGLGGGRSHGSVLGGRLWHGTALTDLSTTHGVPLPQPGHREGEGQQSTHTRTTAPAATTPFTQDPQSG